MSPCEPGHVLGTGSPGAPPFFGAVAMGTGGRFLTSDEVQVDHQQQRMAGAQLSHRYPTSLTVITTATTTSTTTTFVCCLLATTASTLRRRGQFPLLTLSQNFVPKIIIWG